jgi:6-bladed beta-propeller
MTPTPVRFGAPMAAGHLLLLAFIASQTGCDSRSAEAASPRADGSPPPAPQWTLGASPVVSIGRTDGDEAYLLHDVEGALRLGNGNIVVLNTGTQELKFYSATGEHIRTVGGKGDGPGEFRRPARLYLLEGDTLAVFDRVNETLSRFDANGAFIDAMKSPAPEGEKFARDAWLYRRNFVEGPMTPAGRPPVRLVLDRLPPLPDGVAYRYVRVDRLGRLWVRNEPAPADAAREWLVYGPEGSILGRVETPRSFDPMQTGRDFVLGRAYDEMNVEHVEMYALDAGAGQTAGFLPEAPAGTAPAAQPSEASLREMRSILRNGMGAQEIYYSKPEHGYRYASRADELKWPEDMPEGLDVHILGASQFGWTMIVTSGSEPVLCGAMVGFTGPVGWTPGTVLCGD